MSKKKGTRKKKTTKKAAPVKRRDVVEVQCHVDANPDDATARTITRPEVNAAVTIQKLTGDNHEVNALVRELSAQVAAVNDGDLKRAEGMLVSQTQTLDELLNSLTRRAHANMVDVHRRYPLRAKRARPHKHTSFRRYSSDWPLRHVLPSPIRSSLKTARSQNPAVDPYLLPPVRLPMCRVGIFRRVSGFRHR